MQTGKLQVEMEEYDSTGKSGCKTKAHLIGASIEANCDARHRNEGIRWRLAVKLRGSSCAVCNVTFNPWTLSEVKLLMLFFPSLTAGCVSSEQQVLDTTESSKKANTAPEGKEHDQVTFSPGSLHFCLQEMREVLCILSTCPRASAQRRPTSQTGRSMTR